MTPTQQGLFDNPGGQAAHLARVRAKIGDAVLGFCAARLAGGRPEFHAADLREHVARQVPETAPDSPSRILRALRREGRLGYEVVSRKASLYRVAWARDGPGELARPPPAV